MGKSWLLCVLAGTLAWGQAQPGTAPAQSSPSEAPGAAGKAAEAAVEVPENAVVLTIQGVCPAVPKAAATAKAGAGKTAATPKKPAVCKTEITRAQFEKIANSLSPNVTPQLKRQLEQALPRFMAMSEAAKAKGLDKTPQFAEKMKILKMQILTTELQLSVKEEAEKISPAEIADYYKKNPEAYQQFSLERLFVPRFKQMTTEEKEAGKAPEKLTEDQQKAQEAADKAKQEEGEQAMNKLADALRARAGAGEDFVKLQKEAFEAAGTKVENPTVNLPKVRRNGLPVAHAPVFDLKPGEVSAVITDNGGHYIYKVLSAETLPLDQVKDEIHNKLKSERMKEMMDKYSNSFQAVPNEVYFGPAAEPGRMGLGQAPGPRTQGAQTAPAASRPQEQRQNAAPSAKPADQAPAAEAPASKPN